MTYLRLSSVDMDIQLWGVYDNIETAETGEDADVQPAEEIPADKRQNKWMPRLLAEAQDPPTDITPFLLNGELPLNKDGQQSFKRCMRGMINAARDWAQDYDPTDVSTRFSDRPMADGVKRG
ncbi:hypothetical protein FZEAL_1713 [Fusarium zealandicum]|uniref:Uncharacterized protein n=1 Tax=Fusarium zealandicum TaxID=1053134 RepID=A0A8H4US74_9HYPO|nr:hypothetical protein FZEAL_1713 [Fusarium zealandicum]